MRYGKSWLAMLAMLAMLATAWPPIQAAESQRPNVIVILTDDQGSIDANCYGATDLVTPAIDGLAERGVMFTQFYAAAPVCSPSRAGLITGRYPIRAGVPGNVSSQQGQPGMSAEQITMGDTFRAAGYATAHIGKWHLGYTPETMPNNQGFDHSFGHMGGCIDNYSHFFYWQGPNRHDLWRNGVEVFYDGRYFPDLMVDETVRFIDQREEKPFFVYFALNLPHYPYQGDAHWLEYYRDLPYPRNLYAAFMSAMDARIGRLIQELQRRELLEQTIIAFQSDHGHSREERAHFGGGDAGPYRGAKFSLFEGGIRVPSIISWPGNVPEDAVRDQMAHSCDWLPTLAELCDVPLLNPDIDGKRLVPVLQSDAAPSPHEVLHWTIGNSWAVRQGDWKLLAEPRDPLQQDKLTKEDRRFLVNLADDVSELKNVAAEYPQKVQQLEALHQAWIQQAGGRDQ